MFIISLCTLLISVVLFITSRVYYKKSNCRDVRHLLENSNSEAKYLALQNQINPHFLYNTLEGIRSDALISGSKELAKIVESLAVYFRYTISKIDKLVTLEEEIINIKNYLVIQNYRFGDRIKFIESNLSVDSSIYEILVPKLILQPFIENSIIHGLEGKVDKGEIELILIRNERVLNIVIEDNGIGITKEKLLEISNSLKGFSRDRGREGIAIRNVSDRVKLLCGEDYGLNIRSITGVGTAVEIRLPVNI